MDGAEEQWARLFAPLATLTREVAAVAFLGPTQGLLGMRHVAGSSNWCALPIRTVARDAIALDARQVVLAHNHPSGDHRPSPADLVYTRRLALCLGAMEIPLLDHLVVTSLGTTSLRAAGLL